MGRRERDYEAAESQYQLRIDNRLHEPCAVLNYQVIRELLRENRLIIDHERGYIYANVSRNGKTYRKELSRSTSSGIREIAYTSPTLGRRFYLKRSHIVWCATHPHETIPPGHVILHLDGRKNNDRSTNLVAVPRSVAASSRERAKLRLDIVSKKPGRRGKAAAR